MKTKPVTTFQEAIDLLIPGQTVMVGGFMSCGSPPGLLGALRDTGRRGLHLVCNDGGVHRRGEDASSGVAINIADRQFSIVTASHIGLNTELQRQMAMDETEVRLVPQGTLVERIRAAGAGLGGVLTPTGVGTDVARGKRVIEVDGRSYLLEKPLGGDVALLRASVADRFGNLFFAKATRSFAPIMATACKTVIVEVDELIEDEVLPPDKIHTPSVFVDLLVPGGEGELGLNKREQRVEL